MPKIWEISPTKIEKNANQKKLVKLKPESAKGCKEQKERKKKLYNKFSYIYIQYRYTCNN